ncbi:MAG: hypothetical protein ACKVTZ_05765 [Bacteroidia bacterium]
MKSFFHKDNPRFIDICLIFSTTILLALLFRQVLWDLNNFMFAAGGDGLKIHYTLDYYAQHGQRLYFDGFQYPFGTHLLGVENPLFLVVFRWFAQNIYDITPYSVLIINLLMLSSYYLAVLFIYRILRKTQLPTLFAFCFSLLITFFSPQTFRLAGHYYLSFICFFPMIWYAWIKIEEGDKTRFWLLFLFFTTLIFSFFHLYYFVMGSGFVLANIFFRLLQDKKKWLTQWKKHTLTIVCALLPFLFVQIWIKLTTVGFTDVVKHPWGFLHYIASFNSVFLPMEEPQKTFFDFFGFLVPKFLRFLGDVPPNYEGRAYVGFFGFVLLLFLLFRIGKLLFQKKFRRLLKPVLPTSLQTSVYSALLLLWFAMGYPFEWFDDVEKWAGPFTQFRSSGRFAWVFYYVYMTLLAHFLYALFRHLGRVSGGKLKTFAYTIFAFVLTIYALESAVLLKPTLDYVKTGDIKNNYPNWRNADIQGILKSANLQATDFQAILSFPYFHIGSEKFGIEGTWFSQFYGYTASRKTGLPLLNNFSARTPLSLTLPSLQLMSHPAIKKDILQAMKNKKPLLLVYSHEPKNEREQYIIDKSEKIGELKLSETEKITFAKVNLSIFEDAQAEIITAFQTQKANLVAQQQTLLSHATTNTVIAKSYGDAFGIDNQANAKHLWLEKGKISLLDTTISVASENTQMEFSIWVRLDVESNYLPAIFIKQFQGDKQVNEMILESKFATDICQNWVRLSAKFPIFTSGNRLFMEIEGKKLAFDNLLLRPVDTDVYLNIESDKKFVWNNYFIGN